MRTTIKLVFCPEPNLLDYIIWGVLENKINATFHANIVSLKNVIGKEWNKMPEKFILKACKSFRMRVDAIIGKKKEKEKNGGHIE